MNKAEQERLAKAMVKEMTDNPRVAHPADTGARRRRDRVRVEFPGLVDVRHVGENGGKSYVIVVPRETPTED